MREILFRGQTRKFGEKVRVGDGAPVPGNWVYGGVLQGECDFSVIYAVDEAGHFDGKHTVYSDTLGQYTGLRDKNGTRIFEGDIIRTASGAKFKIYYDNNLASFIGIYPAGFTTFNSEGTDYCIEIIGNIYDNKETPEVNDED